MHHSFWAVELEAAEGLMKSFQSFQEHHLTVGEEQVVGRQWAKRDQYQRDHLQGVTVRGLELEAAELEQD